MAINLNEKFIKPFVSENELNGIRHEVSAAHKLIREKSGLGSDFLGWVDLPVNYDRDEFARIKAAAEKIKKLCRGENGDKGILIVIGIGGSYLGARAAIEFVKSPLYNNMAHDTPDVYFAGNTISPSAVADLVKICEGREICINVVSKSGNTTEPAIAFRIFRDLLIKKYGEKNAYERIFATTDKKKGALKGFADAKGCETFVVPDDIGGRYSVLSAVGLLPIAVAGIDIDEMMRGAADARTAFAEDDLDKNAAYRYAAFRNILMRRGKTTELLVGYDPAMTMFNEWWKQLFGESEGKDGKGIFPASVVFSTDLHSMGQYIQDGMRNLFETVIDVQNASDVVTVPGGGDDDDDSDKVKYLVGRTLHDINRTAMTGTLFAHNDGGVPNMVVEIPDRSEYSFGWLVYFFELACAASGYLNGVNPFDQPGVEKYKNNMYALLGKKGYEELSAQLNATLNK